MQNSDANTPVLQHGLREKPWMDPRLARLPGVLPLDPVDDWIRVDEAYGPQMALRRHLIDTKREAVHGVLPHAREAADEMLDLTLARVQALGFAVRDRQVLCPDGAEITVDRAAPLITLGRIVQADICLMLQDGPEHHLAGAILCFPASWTLSEKLGRPLIGIHRPVQEYDADQARRVQRLFDAIRPGQPLWRSNALAYADPSLHHPRSEHSPRNTTGAEPCYIRSERQVLLRLPRTRAVAFVIHTSVVLRTSLSAAEEAAFQPL